jgi:hypothetical protein
VLTGTAGGSEKRSGRPLPQIGFRRWKRSSVPRCWTRRIARLPVANPKAERVTTAIPVDRFSVTHFAEHQRNKKWAHRHGAEELPEQVAVTELVPVEEQRPKPPVPEASQNGHVGPVQKVQQLLEVAQRLETAHQQAKDALQALQQTQAEWATALQGLGAPSSFRQ